MAINKCKLKYSHQFIIFLLSTAAFLHNILMNGANNVILSSLQKEFYLTSKETGIYVSVYDIGSLISSILVSFASARGSKPRWIAFGMSALFVGCMIDIVPHFIKPKTIDSETDISNLDNKNNTFSKFDANSIELCNYSVSYLNNEKFTYIRPLMSNETITYKTGVKKLNTGFFQLKHILYLGNMINGFSSASMTTITFSYIEDMAPPHLSAVYESIYYAVGAFGMGVGFIITSKFLTLHTDINEMKELPAWLNTSHPNWIGAWWLPFLLFGFISLILAMIIFTFPRKLNHAKKTKNDDKNDVKEKEPLNNNEMVILNDDDNMNTITEESNDNNQNDNIDEKNEIKQNGLNHHNHQNHKNNHHAHHLGHNTQLIIDTLEQTGSLLSLNQLGVSSNQLDKQPNNNNTNNKLRSPTKSVAESLPAKRTQKELINSTFSLLKKPIYLSVILAQVIEGLLQNSFLAFAALFLEYQYRLASGTASFVLGLLSIPPLMVGGILSGVIVKKLKNKTSHCFKFLSVVLFINIIVYSGFMIYCKEPNMINESLNNNNNKNDYSPLNCNCNRKIFKPVCLKDSNDVFFQSACLAGCSEFDRETDIYSNCTHEFNTFTSSANYFINGLCPTQSCNLRLVISYACIFFLMFLNALTFLPYLKVTIGTIDNKEMNSIGLGLKQFFMNGFGTIPGPILFGSVIDSACNYWHTDQNDQRVCKIYNNERFAFGFGLLGIGFKTLCFLLVVLCIILLRRQKKK